MRYRFIQAEKAQYPVEMLCRVMGVARSGFYAWSRQPDSARERENQWLGGQLRACYHEFHGRYGSPRLHQELQARGIRIGRHRVARLMRVHGLQGRCRRRARRPRPCPPEIVVANALQRDFAATRPNQKWAGDITYIATREGWLYVAVLLDLYSRRIVGWAMGAQLSTALTIQALEMALHRRSVGPGLLHHSDRGCQYAAMTYQQRLTALGMHCSMSRPGNCWDNAVVESFFATLKTELIYHRRFQTRQEAKTEIFEYLEGFYNRQRRHSSLGYLSPVEFERQAEVVIQSVH
jgi:putative transposase